MLVGLCYPHDHSRAAAGDVAHGGGDAHVAGDVHVAAAYFHIDGAAGDAHLGGAGGYVTVVGRKDGWQESEQTPPLVQPHLSMNLYS